MFSFGIFKLVSQYLYEISLLSGCSSARPIVELSRSQSSVRSTHFISAVLRSEIS